MKTALKVIAVISAALMLFGLLTIALNAIFNRTG